MPSKLLSSLRSALFGTLSLLATASLAQMTVHVGPGQTYTTIQSGIDAAGTGDTVLVAPGTYNENIDFKGKAITVTSSDGAAKTILDGGSKGPAVSFITNETSASIISGFTIQHGGNFIQYGPSYSPALGSIYVITSSPTIADNIITLSNCWGIVSDYSLAGGAPTILNNTISATQDIGSGCPLDGGAAIFIFGGVTDPSYPGDDLGGIIYGNTLENNIEASLEDGSPGGAGIVAWGGVAIIANNIIRNNFSYGTGTAINISSDSPDLIFQNLIYGNGSGCGGGAISTDGQAVYVVNNTIVDNTWTNQGGYSDCTDIAQIYPSPPTYGTDSSSDMFVNNIISGSTSYPAINCSSTGRPSENIQPTFQNNILYNSGGPFFGARCVDVSGKYNNIAADPQFTDPANHNYTLKSTSPAIDHGQNSVLQTVKNTYHQIWSQDFAGNPRVADVTGNGCNIDIGAYEYPSSRNDCGVSETLASSLNPAQGGQSVTFTAQLTAQSGSGDGTPTGLIEFLDGTTLLASQAVSSKGSAVFTTSALTVGAHTITANYQPTGNFGAATASLVEVINGDPTRTALTCQPGSIAVYGTAQFTATVTSASVTPAGSVAFADDTTVIATQPLINGATTLTYTGATVGAHSIIATYEPTGPFAQSAAASCSEIVSALPTTSTLTVTPATSTYGSPVTLTATVSPVTQHAKSTPGGSVTFLNGASVLGTVALSNGVATFSTSALSGGSYNLTCAYSGSSIYAPSNCSQVPITVHAAPTTLTILAAKNPAIFPAPVTFTIQLSVNGHPAPAGNTIQLTVNGKTVPLTTDAAGTAVYSIGGLTPASYPVLASFTATDDLLSSSASLTEVITQASTTISLTGTPNPGNLHQTVTFTATVSASGNLSPPASGTVTFFDGTTSLGSSPLSSIGTATLTASFSALGVHNITARYGGSENFITSTSAAFPETIIAGDFLITVSPGSATLYTGQSASFKVNLASLNGFDQPLALSCLDLPANTTCTFTPASFSNGQGTANLILQTSAPHKTAATSTSAVGRGLALSALAFLLIPGLRRRRRFLSASSAALLTITFAFGLSGCSSTHPIAGGTPPGTYQVAVAAATKGSGNNLTHSATVSLFVKSLF